MKPKLALPMAALIGVASVVPISVDAFSSPVTPGIEAQAAARSAGAPATAEDRYGVVRYDTAARRWAILSAPGYESRGLTGISCSASTGVLTVRFTPLRSIGTFTVDEDDAYVGRVQAGASPTRQSLGITFRRPTTGVKVSCNAKEVRVANSSLQLWVRGNPNVPTPPTPTRPGPPTPATQPPTSQPATTLPVPPPPSPVTESPSTRPSDPTDPPEPTSTSTAG